MPLNPRTENHLAELADLLETLATECERADSGVTPDLYDEEPTRAETLRSAARVVAALPCRHDAPPSGGVAGDEIACRFCGVTLRLSWVAAP